MIGKLSTALAVPFLLSNAAPQRPVFVKYHFIEQVICENSLGSAVRIADGSYVSALHVTSNIGCTVADKTLAMRSEVGALDYAAFGLDGKTRRGVPVNCDGLKPGEWAFAIGYARGQPKQQLVTLRYWGSRSPENFAVLHGRETVVPGMSGGAVLNQAGELVALVNMYNPMLRLSFLRELKDTPLCEQA